MYSGSGKIHRRPYGQPYNPSQAMNITIQELSAQNRHDLNRCNGAFMVDSKLILHAENDIPY